MVILLDVEKSFDKMSYPVMIKVVKRQGMEGANFNIVMAMPNETSQHSFNQEKLSILIRVRIKPNISWYNKRKRAHVLSPMQIPASGILFVCLFGVFNLYHKWESGK